MNRNRVIISFILAIIFTVTACANTAEPVTNTHTLSQKVTSQTTNIRPMPSVVPSQLSSTKKPDNSAVSTFIPSPTPTLIKTTAPVTTHPVVTKPTKSPTPKLTATPTQKPTLPPETENLAVLSFTATDLKSASTKFKTTVAEGFKKHKENVEIRLYDTTTVRAMRELSSDEIFDAVEEARMSNDSYTVILSLSYEVRYNSPNESEWTLFLKIDWEETSSQTTKVQSEVKEIIDNIITPEMNDFDIARAINKFMVTTYQYDTTLSKYSAYELVTTGSAVCQGYALLACALFEEAGIESVIAWGKADNGTGSQDHAWNIVKLDGNWYILDVTWNDPLPDRGNRYRKNPNERYFLLTDDELDDDHSWEKKNFPSATTPYND